MKLLLTLAMSASVAASATGAFAEGLADTVNARSAGEATVGMHLSLGGKAFAPAKPVYGASLGIRQGGQAASQALNAPVAKFAEMNFSGGKLADARVGAMSFTSSASGATGQRLGFDLGSSSNWIITGLLLGGAAFIITDDKQNQYDWHNDINKERLHNPDK